MSAPLRPTPTTTGVETPTPQPVIAPAPRGIEQSAAAGAPPPPIALHIERLVFEGIPLGPRDRQRLQAALEAEWSALVSGSRAERLGGAMAAGAAWPRLRADDIPIGDPADAEAIGRAIARSLHAGVHA